MSVYLAVVLKRFADLDPIFITVLKTSTRGVTVATVIAMALSIIVLLVYFMSGRTEIPFWIRYVRFKMVTL
jgi:Na+-driven multidrug efflux pump